MNEISNKSSDEPVAAAVPRLGEVVREVFARQQVNAFPKRVLEAIARQENSSEILIKLIQLTVFGIWVLLYAAAPKTDAGTAFSPVPYALAGYMALNLIGLIWASRRALPDWSVYVNIVIDISVLMILIWSFHIQYGQPPSFYLKAPTLLYIFIFIALRALRFQARFVIAAGVFSALGWTAMTLYAVMADPSDNMITRNYIEYLTGNEVLIGAEVDKIVSILLVTVILALAIRRANGLLVRSVAESIAARDLSRFFDAQVAEKITSADQMVNPGEGVRREAAILFVDIRGFTPMAARLDASAVVALLTAYEARILPIIRRHGGSIDKFLGDGIMATFGAVAESGSYAADALRAVDDLIAEAERWSDDPQLSAIAGGRVNAAVAAGPVVFGALGGENRLEYTCIGSPVNLAAKLEKHNSVVKARALTDMETWRKALAQGYAERDSARRIRATLQSVAGDTELIVLHPL